MRATKRLFKGTVAVLMCIVTSILASGCWDQREFSDIAVVMGIAVDSSEEKKQELTVGVQVANPVPYSGSSGDSGSKEAYSDFSGSGNSIFEIIRGITHISSRRLYHAHNQIVVFGSSIAENEGIRRIIDYFLRDNEMRYNVLLAVSEDKATEIFSAGTNYEKVPAQELAELIENQAANSCSAVCTLIDFAKYGTSVGATALVPIVKIKEAAETGKDSGEGSSSEKSGSSESSGDKQSPQKSYEVTGAAVFDGDKMVGKLSEEETRGALWVRDSVTRAIVRAQTEKLQAEIEVFNCRTHVDAKINEEGKAVAKIRCEVYSNIAQVSDSGVKLDTDTVKKIAEACGGVVKEEIEKAYEKSVEIGCDIFNLGEKIKDKDLKQWRKYEDDWKQLYKELDLQLDVNINIEDIGNLSSNVQWRETDEKNGNEKEEKQ